MRRLLTRMLFLPNAYHVVVFCMFLLFLLLFVLMFLFLVYLFLLCAYFVSLPGEDVLCCLLSCLCLLSLLFFSECLFGLIWFDLV